MGERLTFRTTGVTAAVVERMETQLKEDVLHEIRKGEGRVLLHDEVETKPGSYEIIPIWENVQEHEVMTPREMYQGVIEEHYRVDYARVAIVRRSGEPELTIRPMSKLLYRRLCKSSLDGSPKG